MQNKLSLIGKYPDISPHRENTLKPHLSLLEGGALEEIRYYQGVKIGQLRGCTLKEEILARSNFGEFGELPKKFAKFAKICSRQI